ncbi:hypothetical protein N0V82_006352 [Gnomoniopsis sp. IMI 355080]|nr:hypothetical protein N0V82_006352 [Gnomoniopsis sp. IMI 355080]
MASKRGPDSDGSLPPFPTGLKEAPITRISYSKIASKDATECERLFLAVQERSFFYLDFTHDDDLPPADNAATSILTAATALHDVAESAFGLPFEEKNAVSTFKTKSVFGFKAGGQTISKDPQRRVERVEFFNVAKDDIVALSEGREPPTGIQYPAPLVSPREGLPYLSTFVRNAHPIGMKVLEILAAKLDMSYEDIAQRHRFNARSGDDARFTYAPGLKEEGHEKLKDEELPITTWEHTDYGSLTILFNWLGGLQIINRKTNEWEWVRPIPGCAICNIGDSMEVFTGGKLLSGVHRVLAAPGQQATLDRYSLVYFIRPEDHVKMVDLTLSLEERKLQEAEAYGFTEWFYRKVLARIN